MSALTPAEAQALQDAIDLSGIRADDPLAPTAEAVEAGIDLVIRGAILAAMRRYGD